MKAIDLFAGAGGFSLAAFNLGIQIVAAIEIDALACETYRNNLIRNRCLGTHLINKDILNVDPNEFMKDVGLKTKELDILMGGPPCQGFSSHRIKNSGVDDPRNALLISYFDFVSTLKPKIFLLENVPGLLWDRHKSYLEKFKFLAEEHGYHLFEPERINAKDFGVPQNRSRVFIVGVRQEIKVQGDSWPPNPTHFKDKTPLWKSASEVFEKPSQSIMRKINRVLGEEITSKLSFGETIQVPTQDLSAIHMIHSEDLIRRFSTTPINGSREDIDFTLPCHSNGYKGHKDVYGRIRLAQPGPTITTGCINPSKGRFLHPWLNHGITIRHAARFQTFPDDYLFSGGIISQSRQVGNAVPVILGEAVIRAALDCLDIK
ncbi:DNA cytosine methyltransferase [Photorhabdus sp. CRCIA-P01]|uniref:DNA cytosine methyltransferase n=1 Tax=Photorhabdus sp. CRCIA-P01 TaxID=2019570 RepID=UPI000E59B67D|nr:DNA cytosine methyltransferase [Photorhabdus sp. CRCIA-P01]